MRGPWAYASGTLDRRLAARPQASASFTPPTGTETLTLGLRKAGPRIAHGEPLTPHLWPCS